VDILWLLRAQPTTPSQSHLHNIASSNFFFTHFSHRWVIHPQLSYSCLWWLLRVLVGWLFVCCVLRWPISIWSLVFRSINVWDFYIWWSTCVCIVEFCRNVGKQR
jgi:hypothetical protein